MKQKDDNTSFWDNLHGIIHSRIGGLVVGEDVYSHGYSLLHDLLGKASFFQIYLLQITGKLPDKSLSKWLEALFVLMSYPDSRIWCNQIGSLAGSLSASSVSAVSAGVLASDSKMYGPGVALATANLILGAFERNQSGLSIESIVDSLLKKRNSTIAKNVSGYSRPVARGDERVELIDRYAETLGFERGDYLSIAFEISNILSSKYNERINIAGYASAFLLDRGFSPNDIYRICSPIVHSGVLACYVDAVDNVKESFYPLRCNDIDYQGICHRIVPEK